MQLRLRVAELALAHRGWTMRKVAERLGVDHQTVMYWNQGRTFPRLPMMLTLCRVLGCKLDELVGHKPKKPKKITLPPPTRANAYRLAS